MDRQEIIDFLSLHKTELREKYGVISIGLFGPKQYLEENLKNKVDLGIESTLKPIAKKYILKEMIYV